MVQTLTVQINELQARLHLNLPDLHDQVTALAEAA